MNNTNVCTKSPTRSRCVTQKLPYVPIPIGTLLLIDTSNLVETLGFAHAAKRLSIIAETLAGWGYPPLFVWDYGSYRKTLRKQTGSEEANALEIFVKRDGIVLVDQLEADLVLLQTAQLVDRSVVVSLDRFRDYAAAYPDVVATRRRPFVVFPLEGRTLITIVGMKNALVLAKQPKALRSEDVSKSVSELSGDSGLEIDDDVRMRRAMPPAVVPSRGGISGVADWCVLHGNVRGGYRLLSREAEKRADAYHDIATFVDDADGEGIPHSAAHYDHLAEQGVIKHRECCRRKNRQRAERRRQAYRNVA